MIILRKFLSTMTLWGILSFSGTALTEPLDEILHSDKIQLNRQDLQQFLAYKKIDVSQIPEEKRIKLLKNLYLRERLIKDNSSELIKNSPDYQEKVKQFKKELLAEMSLATQTQKGMPDFSKRAKEIYQADKNEKYTLPMSYQVNFFELDPKQAQPIHQQLMHKSLDLAKAQQITQSGQARWINKNNVSPALWQAAQALSKESPLSSPLYFRDQAWLLYLVDQKPASIIPFANVKADIEQSLKDDYQKNQQALLIKKLGDDFNQAEVNKTLLNQL
ncbi:MAG TPA: hypothetical protein ENK78_06775 [Thiothrix sp.]|nr:hypothetical protein [Thiothrix sp.]